MTIENETMPIWVNHKIEAYDHKKFKGAVKYIRADTQGVAVEKLKKGYNDPIDDSYLDNFHGGWNACIDHLAATGRLK